MANRIKRQEREQKRLQRRLFFKTHFKKTKQQAKTDLRPGLVLVAESKSKGHFHDDNKKFLPLFCATQRLKTTYPDTHHIFIKILKYPKRLFTELFYYEKLAAVFFKIKTCRSLESWKIPKSKNNKVIFKSLFCHLLVKYQIPKCVEAEIFNYAFPDSKDDGFGIRVMLMIADGLGVHRIANIDLGLNGKANYFFHRSPPQLDIEKAIAWSKFRNIGLSYSLSLQLAQKLEVKVNKPLADWHLDLIFFLKRFPDLSQHDLKKILDFVTYQKKEGLEYWLPNYKESIVIPALFPVFEFKGRTVASVLRFVKEWEDYVKLAKENGTNGVFLNSLIKPFKLSQKKTFVTISQIKTLKDLVKEGKVMGHCVGTYGNSCLKNYTSIWSLRKRMPNGKIKNMLTIEVNEVHQTIEQIKGKFNRNPNADEMEWVKDWATKENLKLKLID